MSSMPEQSPPTPQAPDQTQQTPDDFRMPLTEHLDELRGGLIRSLIAVFLGFFVTYAFSEHVILFLEKPLLDILPPENRNLYFTGLTDKFFIYMKVSFISSAIMLSPYLVWEVWRFVSPALHRHEKRFAVPFVLLGTVAFFAGMSFAYFVVIPFGYQFLLDFGSPTDKAIITLTDYFSLTLKLMAALGLVFEVPLLMILLGKFGFVDAAFLRRHRKYAFVVSSVLAAIATPSPDAITMMLVMGPLYLLYEFGIIGVSWVNRMETKNSTR